HPRVRIQYFSPLVLYDEGRQTQPFAFSQLHPYQVAASRAGQAGTVSARFSEYALSRLRTVPWFGGATSGTGATAIAALAGGPSGCARRRQTNMEGDYETDRSRLCRVAGGNKHRALRGERRQRHQVRLLPDRQGRTEDDGRVLEWLCGGNLR